MILLFTCRDSWYILLRKLVHEKPKELANLWLYKVNMKKKY